MLLLIIFPNDQYECLTIPVTIIYNNGSRTWTLISILRKSTKARRKIPSYNQRQSLLYTVTAIFFKPIQNV